MQQCPYPTSTKRRVMRQDFDDLDPDSTGFIQVAELEKLLARYLTRKPQLKLKVPEGTSGGTVLNVKHDGINYKVTVPEGLLPGDQFTTDLGPNNDWLNHSAEIMNQLSTDFGGDPAGKVSCESWLDWAYGPCQLKLRTLELETENKQLKCKVIELEGNCVDVAPSKPLCARGEVTDAMRERQRRDCNKWCTPMQEWCDVIDHIVETPEYKELRKAKWEVSMYDACSVFVKPWTNGSGCGLAVTITQDVEQDAQLMLSHAWGEDIVQCKEALVSFFHKYKLSKSDTVWFCVWANYQAQDGFGPSIGEQLAMDPFKVVIESLAVQASNGGHGMVCIHTTSADLYTRLWCGESSSLCMPSFFITFSDSFCVCQYTRLMPRRSMQEWY